MYGVIIAVSCILGALVWGLYGGKRRRDATPPEVKKLGLHFNRERNYRIRDQFPFLKEDPQISNCYAFNTISGLYQGHEIVAFDYHYETSGAAEHHVAFFTVTLPSEGKISTGSLTDVQQRHPELEIVLHQNQLALRFDFDLKTELFEPRLKQLIEIRNVLIEKGE